MIAYLVIGVTIFLVGFGAGWKIDSWKNSAEREAEIKAAIAAKEAAEERASLVSDRFEKKLSSLRITNRTFFNEVRHEVEKTVYGNPDCNLPASGIELRNRAIDTANQDPTKPATDLRKTSKTSN